ncbi:U3 small nucleolar RNA-associated-like protein [Scenedesmus sp. PABB004]|nr:U3 small nucleolar RNA-associated-like protein [Scenedesmus sp. PABB004]
MRPPGCAAARRGGGAAAAAAAALRPAAAGRARGPAARRAARPAQEAELEDFLFGGGAGVGRLLAGGAGGGEAGIAELVRAAEADAGGDDADGELFFEDRGGDDGGADGAAGPGPGSARLQQQGGKGKKRRAPAWVDPADRDARVAVADAPRLRKLRATKAQTELSGAEYEAALRRQHAKLNPRTGWAAAAKRAPGGAARGGGGGGGGDDAQEPDEETAERLLASGSGLLLRGGGGGAARGGLLAPGTLELSRLRDANGASPSDAVVQALQFHPNGQLMLTAGFDKRLKIFQVDGLRNPLVSSLFLEDCPIHTAAFAAGGATVVAAGRRPFYYVADLHSGALERVVAPPSLYHTGGAKGGAKGGGARGGGGGGMKSCESFAASPAPGRPLLAFLGDGGHIGLVSLGSRAPVGSLKMNGSARAAAFSADGATLVTAGGDGVLYTWDMRSQRCLQRQRDEGALDCASLALSADGSYLATGGAAGVVSVYARPAGLLAPLGGGGGGGGAGGGGAAAGFGAPPAAPAPLKALMNLTTTVDTLAFSHDGQMLLMGSRLKREALRVAHLPSLTVFSNWPTTRSPLHYVHCAAFSPHGGFLGVGNAKGRALLYRLHHYAEATCSSGARRRGPAVVFAAKRAVAAALAPAAAAPVLLAPALAFSSGTYLMAPIYLTLAFFPRSKLSQAILSSALLPLAFAAAYAVLAWQAWQGGDLGAVQQVLAASRPLPDAASLAALFQHKTLTALAWLHLLLLDFLTARAVLMDGLRQLVPTAHSVLLCFMVGPLGLLSHVLTRLVVHRLRGDNAAVASSSMWA